MQDKETLISWLRELYNIESSNTSILVISRKEQDIEAEIESWLDVENFISLESAAVGEDI